MSSRPRADQPDVRPRDMTREVPKVLYDELFELSTEIAQPWVGASDEFDEERAAAAFKKLEALYQQRQRASQPDPALTEALADFTDDASAAVALYELALQQCAALPDEPRHTKRIAMARRLVDLGRRSDAAAQLMAARDEASAIQDADALAEVREVLTACEV